jgi:hypothetical protein
MFQVVGVIPCAGDHTLETCFSHIMYLRAPSSAPAQTKSPMKAGLNNDQEQGTKYY